MLLVFVVGLAGSVAASSAAAAPLVVSSYASPGNGPAPLNVYFQANVTGGTGVYASITWSFGDGDLGSGISVRHTYPAPGNYSVVLTVTDSSGARAWANLSVRALASGIPSSSSQTGGTTTSPVVVSFAIGLGIGAGGAAIRALAIRRMRLARSGAPDPDELPIPLGVRPNLPEHPLAVTPTDTVAAGSMVEAPPAEPRRISAEVVVHLQSLGGLRQDEVADPLRTQSGMVLRLDVPQNVLSPVLRRLEDAGVVRSELRHVRGRGRRLKVYRLSDRGIELARELRARGAERGSIGAHRSGSPVVGSSSPTD